MKRLLFLCALALWGCLPGPPPPPPLPVVPASPYFLLDRSCIWGNQRYYFLKITVAGGYTVQYGLEWGDPVQSNLYWYWPQDRLPTDVTLVVPNRPVQFMWQKDVYSPWQIASRMKAEAPTTPCKFQ